MAMPVTYDKRLVVRLTGGMLASIDAARGAVLRPDVVRQAIADWLASQPIADEVTKDV